MFLKSAHWLAAQGMRKAGFQWEVRRSGDLKIGLWRKTWAKPASCRVGERGSPAAARRLVLIPGFGDTPLSWMATLALLGQVIRRDFDEITLVDFPGFAGFLSDDRAFPSIDLLKACLFDTLDGIRPGTILGHSLGGWLSILYAVECAEGIRPKTRAAGPDAGYDGPVNLILADPSGVFPDEAAGMELRNKFLQATSDPVNGFRTIRKHVFVHEPFWLRWAGGQIGGFFRNADVRRFIESFDRAHSIEGKRLGSVRARIWLVWGEKDSLVPPTSIPVFMKAMGERGSRSACHAVLIKDCGHSPHIEAPASLAVVLSQVFAEIAGRPARFHHFPAAQRFLSVMGPEG